MHGEFSAFSKLPTVRTIHHRHFWGSLTADARLMLLIIPLGYLYVRTANGIVWLNLDKYTLLLATCNICTGIKNCIGEAYGMAQALPTMLYIPLQ